MSSILQTIGSYILFCFGSCGRINLYYFICPEAKIVLFNFNIFAFFLLFQFELLIPEYLTS